MSVSFSLAARRMRAENISAFLATCFPGHQKTPLKHRSRFQLLVAVMLSAQCTDVRVNKVTPSLFFRFPTAVAMAGGQVADIARLISSVNYYHTKARHIHASSVVLRDKHKGKVPGSMPALLTLPGVARKTANVVLSDGFGVKVGVVVDTHVMRLCQRFLLTKEKTPTAIERELMKLIPQKDWRDFSLRLVLLGRIACPARQKAFSKDPLLDIKTSWAQYILSKG